jgi:hypothetical protein
MKAKYAAVTRVGGLILLGLASGFSASQSAAPPSAGADAVGFAPRFDDLMTLLIQPRHIKLYYAGMNYNWELAAFELAELRSAFRQTARVFPTYRNDDVTAALQAFAEPKMQAVEAAVKTGDRKSFVAAYAQLTSGCNACHAYLEHPFVVITVPASTGELSFPDQRFR